MNRVIRDVLPTISAYVRDHPRVLQPSAGTLRGMRGHTALFSEEDQSTSVSVSLKGSQNRGHDRAHLLELLQRVVVRPACRSLSHLGVCGEVVRTLRSGIVSLYQPDRWAPEAVSCRQGCCEATDLIPMLICRRVSIPRLESGCRKGARGSAILGLELRGILLMWILPLIEQT